LCFLRSLNLEELAVLYFSSRGDSHLALQVRSVELRDARSFQAIQNILRRMAVAIEFAQGDDGGFRLRVIFTKDVLEKVVRGRVLRAMMRDLQNIYIEIRFSADQAIFRLRFRVAREKH